MTITLLWIFSSVIFVSLISLIGIFTFGIKSNIFDKMLILLVSFAAGSLMGGAFLHLLPEAIGQLGCESVFFYTLIGFTFFFFMERYFYWRHCHKGVCDVHTFTYLNLIGDGVHNFSDGLIIAASFMTDIKLGLITTVAVIFHEIPQEIGDFGILVYGGLSKRKALLFNFLCSLAALVGAVIGYLLSIVTKNISLFLISFTSGGFIYIAAVDLLPELHKQRGANRTSLVSIFFILGILFMALTKLLW